MQICVIDGQGGGIGAVVIKKLKEEYGEAIMVLAVGTNAVATAQMMKAGANRGATGEKRHRGSHPPGPTPSWARSASCWPTP